MHILASTEQLQHVALCLDFCESFPPAHQLIQRLILAYFQDNIHILLILEKLIEFHDVLIAERFVDLDLAS